MPTCEDIREEFSALPDEELDSESRDTVEAHLSNCSECLRELHQYKSVTDLYRDLPEVQAPEGFERDVMLALQPRISRRAWGGRLVALAAAMLLVSGMGYVIMIRFPAMKSLPPQASLKLETSPKVAPEEAADSGEAAASAGAPTTFAEAEMASGTPAPSPDEGVLPDVADFDGADGTHMDKSASPPAPVAAAPAAPPLPAPPASAAPAETSPKIASNAPARAAGAPEAKEERTIAGRVFLRVDEAWQEQG